MSARTLRRLRRMGLGEVACRGRQEAHKWLERAALAGRVTPAPTPAVEPLVALEPARFFAGASHAGTPLRLVEHAPGACRQIVDAADRVVAGRFDLLGYRDLSFGDPIDWHLDPVSGVRAPFVHWSRLDPLDARVVGDSKVSWELNRHQWMVTLGQAYRLTGDERFSDMFVRSVRDWLEANPRGRGINWASSLEVAFRLIAWCWALFLFRRSPRLDRDLFAGLVDGVAAHAAHVERYLSHYFSPNTHLTGEALGLLYAGLVFPELARAGSWRRRGLEILIAQAERQISADGVYFEQSTCYQRYTAEFYLHALILAARGGLAVPAEVGTRLQVLLDVLLWARHPDGSMPMIGDADGGWLVPLAPRAPDDLRGVFSTAAAWFGRADYAWAAGGSVAPETLWLLGPAGLDVFSALRPGEPTGTPSRLFGEGGYAVMRSGWARDAHHLIADVGPLGAFGHGHADLLSVQCAAWGTPCLVDAGTGVYIRAEGWRDFFRGTAAHSTVTVDGQDQAVSTGAFRWQAHPSARLRRWWSDATLDFVDAEHEAYRRLADPVTHRRRVLFVKPRYWIIVDDLAGAAEHRVDLRFQFAPLDVTVDSDRWCRARLGSGRGLLVRAFATVPLNAELREGELDPPQGWVSADYGQRRPAPALVYSTVTRLPLRVFTLLLPVLDIDTAPPAVSLRLAAGGVVAGLVFDDTGESVTVRDGLPLVSGRPAGGER